MRRIKTVQASYFRSMPERPDPDALLAQLHAQERPHGRGRLKVYLGMAAGVGKTYDMLSDAHGERKRNVDVVIGYIEPHDRLETAEMARGLESIPTRELEHRDVVLPEFDLDAALARRPQLILIDELAHTNVPGSRHTKRWQDVEELLQAGIDVYTTVNIQHLESLNDVVAQITGVVVGETVPDSLVNGADEVELVDTPPEELICRIQEGKVYVAEKIDQALASFFRKGNLLALRELALRQTAERVDQQVRTYRAAEGSSVSWPTTDRILVCVAPNKLGARVVRSAQRMANALHADLIAVFVESSRQSMITEQDRQRAAEALRLAESLGAETVTLSGADIVAEIVRLARSRNVTTIVVGKPVRPRWREIAFGSVVDALVRSSGDIDVHVITGTEGAGTPLKVAIRDEGHDWAGYAIAVLVTALATGLSELMIDRFALSNLVMIYLVGVAFVAGRRSRRSAILTSVLSVGAFDFFFVPPRGTFAVSDVQYLFTFAVMLVVALSISSLTAKLRDQSLAASRRERRTAALYDLSKKLSSTRSRVEISRFAATKIKEVFNCDAAVLVRSRRTGELFAGKESDSAFEVGANEQAVARWVMEHGKPAGKTTDTLPGAAALYLPLNAERGCVGVVAVKFDSEVANDPGRLHLLETFANQLAVAIDRTNRAKDSHEASIDVERERLRNGLLSSVSHDLRTPLAVISGAAGTLRASPSLTSAKDRELAQSISEEVERLERQVRNLLDMTRIEAGAIALNRDWQSLEELVGAALARTEDQLREHPVRVESLSDLPLLKLDAVLIEQVFVNLLENAARHTPPHTDVWIRARQSGLTVTIEVGNAGPGLDPGDEYRIFQKFHRRADGSQRGFGLGLAICRAIMQAHNGAIVAQNRPGEGVVFLLTLPVESRPPDVPLG